VTGSMRDENHELYRIEPIGDGIHAVVKIDETSLPSCAKPLETQKETAVSLSAPETAYAPGDGFVEIDVLIAYTPMVRAARRDLAALMDLAIEETNQSYRNSDIHIRLNLVDSMEVNYSEAGKSFNTNLEDFVAMRAVNERRDSRGADVAILIVDNREYCGLAYLMPDDALAYGVVYYNCITGGNYTFAHEVGHIQGARHDERTDPSNSPYAYGHGYIHPSTTASQNFRTVMAYDCTGRSCPEIQYWSNPDITYNGIATGTTQTNNNARLLNETAQRVAAFRSRPTPPPVETSFGYNHGWRVDKHPILLADVNGDNRVDIVGFGEGGVVVALGNAGGGFETPTLVLEEFGYQQGWRVDMHPRLLADVNGDNRVDIVGFGEGGVVVALGNGDGSFQAPHWALGQFGHTPSGWRMDKHPIFLADVNGDKRADIVGFGEEGVVIALGKADGTFGSAGLALGEFGYTRGWRTEKHPRLLVDTNGDGRVDIVGFHDMGVRVALGKGDGSFEAPRWALSEFGYQRGHWRTERHLRWLVDTNGDKRADIVGFGDEGVWVALQKSNGTFERPKLVLQEFGYQRGGWRIDLHPRLLVDVNGDGRADIVGFGNDGVVVALGKGGGGFQTPQLALRQFGYMQGWHPDRHPRLLVDVNGDGRADIVAFGNDKVSTALGKSNGAF